MWLYIPNDKRTSASTQVEADSISVSDEKIQQLSACFTWRETSKPPRSWLTILKRDSWMQHLYGLIPPPSTAPLLLEKWIGSLPDSPVSHGASQENEAQQMTAGGSGHTLIESFARLDPEDSCWRMSQVSFGGDSNLYSETWPKAGSMRSGVVSKRAKLEPVIEEKESLFWPTVTTPEYPHYDMKLNEKGRRIPKKGKTDHSVNLEDTTRNWPTPSARDHKGGYSNEAMVRKDGRSRMDLLPQVTERWEPSPQGQTTENDGQRFSPNDQSYRQRQLNTRFVEWMMGLPLNWLVLHSFVSSETE